MKAFTPGLSILIICSMLLGLVGMTGVASAENGFPVTLFADDFESGDAAEWTVSEGNAVWSVTDIDGNHCYCGDGVGKAGISIAGDTQWVNYEVTADLVLKQNAFPGVIVRYQNASQFYTVNVEANTSKIKLFKKNGTSFTLLKEASYEFENNKRYSIKIGVNGNDFEVYLDGILKIEHTDSSYASGAIGFRAVGEVTCFDNVEVKASRSITGYETVTASTYVGQSPQLPEQITAYFDFGSNEQVAVVWDDIAPEQLAEPGFIQVEGTVQGSNIKATALIQVLNVPLSSGVQLYVSPNGVGIACTLADPCALQEARDQARALDDQLQDNISIYLRGGEYRLTDTLEFTSEDSGRNGFKVYYKAYQDEHPVVSGGIDIQDWALHDPELNIYRAAVDETFETRQLFIDGVRAQRAKGGALEGASKTDTGYTTTDLDMAQWDNIGDIEFVYRKLWTESRCGVEAMDASGQIVMDQPCFAKIHNTRSVQGDLPTWIENAYPLLDEAGEWYHDRTNHYLYYIPRVGEDLTVSRVVAPTLQTLVRGVGTLDAPIKDIVFEGIVFSYSTWLEPNTPNGFRDIQAGLMSPNVNHIAVRSFTDVKMPAAVTFSGAHNIHVLNNTFTRMGAVALNLDYGAKRNVVEGNTFNDISGNAVMLGDVKEDDFRPADERRIVENNKIKNNYITQIGNEYHGAVGIWAGYTRFTEISHNEINDIPYSGISVGWGWGETDEGGSIGYTLPTIVENNRVLNNKIWNAMHTMIDGAGIYSLSADRNQLISGNVISDVHTHGAIYLDNKSRYNRVVNNVSYDIEGSNHIFINDNRGNTLLSYNFWDQSAQLYDNSKNGMFVGNQYVSDESLLPASILNRAGLQLGYHHLNPRNNALDMLPPTVPGNLRISDEDMALTDDSVTLRWDASSDNTGVTGYEIVRDGLVVGVTSDTTFIVRNLDPDEQVTLKVAARDAAANLSPYAFLNVRTIEPPKMDNLAYNKKVVVTYPSPEGREAEMHTGREAEYAVDGDITTYSASINEVAWQLQVDLGAIQPINRIFVKMGINYYATDFDIRVSNNGVNFTTVRSVSGFTGDEGEFSFDSVDARYVRLVAIKPTSGNEPGRQMIIAEFEVYNDSNDDISMVNLALHKPARAFYIGGNVTTRTWGFESIVDGDLRTAIQAPYARVWSAAVNLGFVADFNIIEVTMPYDAYAESFNIEISQTGSAYSTIKQVNGFEGGTYTLFSPQTARFVKVTAVSPSSPEPGKQMALAEIGVYNSRNLALHGTSDVEASDGSPLLLPEGVEASHANDANAITGVFAEAGQPWNWLLDLEEIKSFNEIRLLLDAIEESADRAQITIEISADGHSFEPIADRESLEGGWLTFNFEDLTARYLRIKLDYSESAPSTDAQLVLLEAEVYYEHTVTLDQRTTNEVVSDRYYYQQVSEQPYQFQAGDRLEYEYMLLTANEAIGGIDIVTTDGNRLKEQPDWQDQFGRSGLPDADLSGEGTEHWVKRSMVVSPSMLGRTASEWLLAMENDMPGQQFAVKYRNLLVRNAFGKVALRVEMDEHMPIVDHYIQGYEVDTSVTGVSLDKPELELLIDDSLALTATVRPYYADNKAVNWASSDPAILAVDAIGQITGLRTGTATVTVTTVDGLYTAKTVVTVLPRTVRSSNYALNKPAKAYTFGGVNESTTHPNREAYKANDGDLSTFAASNMVYAWAWGVDLEEIRDITLIRGHMLPTGYATEFDIAGSIDGQNYSVIHEYRGFSGGDFQVRIPSTAYRFIQIRALKPNGPGQIGNLMYLAEVEVYQETPLPPELVEKTATFDRNPTVSANIEVEMFLNGHELEKIMNNEEELQINTDYILDGKMVRLTKQYLAGLIGSAVEHDFYFS